MEPIRGNCRQFVGRTDGVACSWAGLIRRSFIPVYTSEFKTRFRDYSSSHSSEHMISDVVLLDNLGAIKLAVDETLTGEISTVRLKAVSRQSQGGKVWNCLCVSSAHCSFLFLCSYRQENGQRRTLFHRLGRCSL